jgi:hypothetical protein
MIGFNTLKARSAPGSSTDTRISRSNASFAPDRRSLACAHHELNRGLVSLLGQKPAWLRAMPTAGGVTVPDAAVVVFPGEPACAPLNQLDRRRR